MKCYFTSDLFTAHVPFVLANCFAMENTSVVAVQMYIVNLYEPSDVIESFTGSIKILR